jgi:hypothetical protein
VHLDYPLDIRRRIDRRWQRRSAAAPVRPRPAKSEGGGRCPACDAPAPVAPKASAHPGSGLIHHHWLCDSCGHAWTTAVHVPR